MTLEEVRRRNDELRQFKRRVLMTPLVWSLPSQLRGQALYHMAHYNTFDDESDHSEGVFFFKGFAWHFTIEQFPGEQRCVLDAIELTIGMEE